MEMRKLSAVFGFMLLVCVFTPLSAMSPFIENFAVRNLTDEELFLNIKYKSDTGLDRSARATVHFYNTDGEIIAGSSIFRNIPSTRNISPGFPQGYWSIFNLMSNTETDRILPVEKFRRVVESITIQDSRGNIVFTLEDLETVSFVRIENSPQHGDVTHVLEIRSGMEK